ncbi:MAG: acyltransferase domain-containing protein, partial [Chromatiaceae bacterium]|nr:acyltransferase domain-containing protein [Chromatiaceae bacterium]
MSLSKPPIAIVGVACRFPGGIDSMDKYWDVLRAGEDVVTEIGDERWSKDFFFHPKMQTPGKAYTWAAGVLSDVDLFDAAFFGISPREACQMDPQHRLLLEMAWEALEDGGQVPERLAGTKCGVYVGISAKDYSDQRMDDPGSGDAYYMTGNALSIAANRISYAFDLRGPSMAIDTACSSSLVALNEACNALWSGDVSTALSGGINLLLSPFSFTGFCQATMLSPRGRCRVFDASGDGYVRSEGGALVFLKPLERAERDGDPIHAVILASGANCDGHSSTLAIPSVDGQEELLRDVYHRAGIEFGKLTYVEAHGTGTAVGDPAECSAVGNVIGRGRRPGNPIPIGSAKSNLGHMESASGMAGLLKVVLAMKHRAIPPSLHLETPNPAIDFQMLNLRPVTELTPLPESEYDLYMGVNSFGFGGANAHVLLGNHVVEKPPQDAAFEVPTPCYLFLSARSEGALDDLARAYEERIKALGDDCYGLLYASALKRQQHAHRLVVTGRSLPELKQRLRTQLDSGSAPGVVRDRILEKNDARAVLVFSGNGSQWQGMGRQLLVKELVFRRMVVAIDRLFEEQGGGFSIQQELSAPVEQSRLHLAEVAQPTLFAIQVGLVELLRERGVQAEAAVGHSVGEVAAAWAAGVLSLDQAVTV